MDREHRKPESFPCAYSAAALLFVTLLLPACGGAPAEEANRAVPVASGSIERVEARPNILLITLDTVRADHLGCSGNTTVQTPTLDVLAAEGARFDFCVAHAPSTLPSHTSILTGTYPTRHGVHSNQGFRLRDGFPTLAGTLRTAGYRTAAFIAAFPLDRRFGLDQGFDRYDDAYGLHRVGGRDIPERTADNVITPALAWLAEQPAAENWFLWVHLYDAHLPYAPPREWAQKIPNDPYSGEISFVDSQLARLFDQLRATHQLDNTLVVITADHGESLGDHGERSHELFAYNATIQVPLIVRFPLVAQPGTVIRQRVRHIDLAPTILAVAHLQAPAQMQGISLLPLLAGDESATVPDSYFEALAIPLTRGWAPLRGIYHDNWKLIDLPLAELYDMESDRAELHNRIDAAAGTADTLRTLLAPFVAEESATPAGQTAESDETREKLAALGYISLGPAAQPNSYSADDDPKRLVQVHNDMERATEYAEEGKTQDAVQLLDYVIARRPDFIFARLYLADLVEKAGDRGLAISTLRRAEQEGIHDPRLRRQMAQMLLAHGDANAAMTVARQLRDADPANADYAGLLAKCLLRKKDVAAAEQLLRETVATHPDYFAGRRDLGFILLDRQRYDEALMQFDFIVQNDPRNPEGYYCRGLALEGLRRPQEAIAAHERALQLAPGFMDAHFRMGLIFNFLGRRDAALEHLRLVVAGAPEPLRSQAMRVIERIESQ